jgi:hypothetical protein
MSELEGRIVAISIGDAPDRARLGFPQREVDRALLSTCTELVRAGAEIAYAGHLNPDGYTFKIFRHLAGAYAGSRETPFRHFVPEPVARGTRYADLLAVLNEGRGVVTTEIARATRSFRCGRAGAAFGWARKSCRMTCSSISGSPQLRREPRPKATAQRGA